MRIIFGAIGGMKIGRGNRSTRRKPTPAPLCPPQNPTWQTRSRSPDRSGGKLATNRLSYGAAFFLVPFRRLLMTRRVTVEVFDPASTRVSGSAYSPIPKMEAMLFWNVARPLPAHSITQTHTDINALSGSRTHDPTVSASDDSSMP
jgi:hypothetical protein